MYLCFDVETTGIPKNYKASICDSENWPRLVEIAWAEFDDSGTLNFSKSSIVKPDGFVISPEVVRVHGITTELAKKNGRALKEVLSEFISDAQKFDTIFIGHNISFDINIIAAELFRLGFSIDEINDDFINRPKVCTMQSSTEFCGIPSRYGLKWPTLSELYLKLFGEEFDAHHAKNDVEATAKCFFALKNQGII